MGQMVGSIAHEIRNPLGSVELFASLLRRDLREQPHLRVYAEHISVAVQSMDRLLANLLSYTKPDCSKVDWHGVEALLDEVLTMAAHAIAPGSVEVRRILHPNVTHIWCDEGKMKQVLLNLVLNAVQAMPSGGVLTVAVDLPHVRWDETPAVSITVSDTGVGIPQDLQGRIFDPFFTTKDHGTGLGLAIVHALVEAHQGRIDVESRPGQGTSFLMTLPHGPRSEASHSEGALVPFKRFEKSGERWEVIEKENEA